MREDESESMSEGEVGKKEVVHGDGFRDLFILRTFEKSCCKGRCRDGWRALKEGWKGDEKQPYCLKYDDRAATETMEKPRGTK